MKQYPLRSLSWYALPLLFCILAMNKFSPPGEMARDPYSSVVIALEFAATAGEVYDTLDPLANEGIRDLNTLNYIDFIFMLVYSLLLGRTILLYSRAINSAELRSFAWAAVFIFLADAGENMMMLRICNIYVAGGHDFGPFIHFLPVFAWVKWGGLATTFAYLGISLIRQSLFAQVVAILFFLPAILMAVTIVDYDEWINRFTTSIFLAFVALLIFVAGFKKADHNSTRVEV